MKLLILGVAVYELRDSTNEFEELGSAGMHRVVVKCPM